MKAWDEVTLACRGLVVDKDANVVARPLPKFFNDFEYQEGEIPYGEEFEAFIKYDGSLGIVFVYEGEVILASRGSFASEQAFKAKEIFEREHRYPNYIWPGYTYAFEIIYPQNRIVVDYGNQEKLVLLAMFHTETGLEVPYELMHWYNHDRFHVVEKVSFDVPLTDYRSTIQGSDEGYIIRFKSGFRMKIKGEEYCRLHRVLTEVSNKSIWQSLKNETSLDEVLDRIPDEYDTWVQKTITDFTIKFKEIEIWHREVAEELAAKYPDKKSFAEQVFVYCKQHGANSAIMFSMKNGSTKWKAIIWDMLYPKFEKAAKTVQELKTTE